MGKHKVSEAKEASSAIARISQIQRHYDKRDQCEQNHDSMLTLLAFFVELLSTSQGLPHHMKFAFHCLKHG